jgi:hypothetical protein
MEENHNGLGVNQMNKNQILAVFIIGGLMALFQIWAYDKFRIK